MKAAAILLVGMLGISAPAHAGVALWRSLEVGDSPEQVKAKLESMPEVERVKVKKRGAKVKLDINMRDAGVAIFGAGFELAASFDGNRLTGVGLVSRDHCIEAGYELATNLSGELAKKYPRVDVPLSDSHVFMKTALDATPKYETSVVSSYLGEDVAVILEADFTVAERPSSYPSGKFGRLAYEIAVDAYDKRAEQCAGMGYRRANFLITYHPMEVYEAAKEGSRRKAEESQAQAQGNL